MTPAVTSAIILGILAFVLIVLSIEFWIWWDSRND